MQEFIDKPILFTLIFLGIALCFGGVAYVFSLESVDIVRIFARGKTRERLLNYLENQA